MMPLLAAALFLAPASRAAIPRSDAILAAHGTVIVADPDGLAATGGPRGSDAQLWGLEQGDRVLCVGAAATNTRDEAAASLAAGTPQGRAHLVVRRGLEALPLSSQPSPPPPAFKRGSDDLSAWERSLASARSEKTASAARDAVTATPPLEWALRADQALWVRFPKGLPAGLHPGDVIETETAAALTTDSSLDFLAVPTGSLLWARVVSSDDDGQVRTLKLVFYKLRLDGGAAYPVMGTATALAGVAAPDLAGVSDAGTIVAAAPLPDADGKRRRGKDLLLDEDARLRVRLREPVSIIEPRSWWRAGPGLWVKTVEKGGRRSFEVTHAVAGRSAAAAGLAPGDLIDSIDSRSADKLDFTQALDALYGPPGTTVKVAFERDGKRQEAALTRGVKVEKGSASALGLPFESR